MSFRFVVEEGKIAEFARAVEPAFVGTEEKEGRRGGSMRIHTIEYTYTDAVGDQAPGFWVGPITRTHIVRYAGVSGDFTPIHHDEPLAQSVGLPAVFAMGMMHAGMLAHLVADWLGLANVRRYRVRFSERVWPGDVLMFAGTVTAVGRTDGVERVEVEVTCHNQDGKRALSGSATAEYPL